MNSDSTSTTDTLQQAWAALQRQGPEAALSLLDNALSPRSPASQHKMLLQFAASAARQAPAAALKLVDALLQREPAVPSFLLLQGRLQDRLGQRKNSAASMLAVLDAADATDAERLQAARMLIRFDNSGTTLTKAAAAYECLGQPLAWADTMLYVAQRGGALALADTLNRQLQEAALQGDATQAREMPRTHLNACGDEARNLAVIRAYRERLLPQRAHAAPPVAPLAGRRLRLGYLSSDYREHPTARLLLGLLRHHDRTQFAVHLYCSGWDDGSTLRRQLIAQVDALHSVSALSDAQAAALMREHELDVLIDISGPTRANRLGILARRPAPVQIGYLAWPGSYGGDLVDYIVADGYVLPPERTSDYPEAIIRLAATYQVNDHRQQAQPPVPTRASLALPADVPVLGMFNDIVKLRREAWDAWLSILREVPAAVLWLLDPGPGAVKILRERMQQLGVEPQRLVLAPALPHAEHQARLACCDLMLDPWPYGGHTTTSDALAAGVPVVALEGSNFAGRVSGGLLRAAGLQEFIQPTVSEYVAFAVRLLRDTPGVIGRARKHLLSQRDSCALFDAPAVARQLEQAYRQTLDCALEGAEPADISCEWPAAPPAAWTSHMLVLDPCLQSTPGHHHAIDEALLIAARGRGWNWAVLGHRHASTDFPVRRCFSVNGYPWGQDWLEWQQATLALAAGFAEDLTDHLNPGLEDAPLPGLLMPTTTLPLLVGMVRWLETLPAGVQVPYLGCHLHAEPSLGHRGNPMAASLSREIMQRLRQLISAGRLAACRFTTEHAALVAPWQAAGAERVLAAPAPHVFVAARRERPRDGRLRLLFIGGMRPEKGIKVLLDALPRLLREVPALDLRLVSSQNNDRNRQILQGLVGSRVSVRLANELPSAAYYQEIADADAVYSAYSPQSYAHKSSGVFRDAQALGLPALVTAETGAAQDLATLGGGAVVIPALDPEALVKGCAELHAQLEQLQLRAAQSAHRYAAMKAGSRWWQLHTDAPETLAPAAAPLSADTRVPGDGGWSPDTLTAVPRVSFVTTCKHRLHYLKQTLPLMVEAGAHEVIVVDYGCPQNTGAWVAANFPQVQVVKVDDDPGFNRSRARNLGADRASGDWLVMIDSDVRAQPGWLDWQRNHLVANAYYRAAPIEGHRDKETWGTFICPRAWFRRVGGYDEAFQGWGGEDDDLFHRLRAAGLGESEYPSAFVEAIHHGDEERLRYGGARSLNAQHVVNHLYIAAKQQVMQAMAPGRPPLKQPGLAERRAMMAAIRKSVARWEPDISRPMEPIRFEIKGLGWVAGDHHLLLRADFAVSLVPRTSDASSETSGGIEALS